ncbi:MULTISPECIES: hypothetical protein [Herbaspirillum]|uniref:hypothetical protein n=1 Tax=Herbaspirillum TaxID=963 RepID=UPI000C0B7DCC|nr:MULTISPECIES: hypothetical protein [Herbaspirillum]MAF04683.1 hypothetical protein [Herbaspirillum sp.]UWE19368.1 hypothetical protein NY669_26700 [Herbaspirillum huttiense]|tara:strand:+ start:1276 stop:1659 length:384 start_codon:yes stop_codon:yes gene_type:complete
MKALPEVQFSPNNTAMRAIAYAAPALILMCAAAMNGGSLTASAWDSLVTSLRGILSSTWVIVLLMIVLIACVWQLAHGGGYRSIGLIIGILAIALIGPDFVTQLATAMPDQVQMQSIVPGGPAPSLH